MSTVALALVLLAPAAPEPVVPIDAKPCVAKGLKWLAEQQRDEGNWAGRADSQPVTTTATAGLALLMEGSTLRTGTYAPNLRRAVEWLEKLAQDNGALAGAHRTETVRPVPTHAHALLFLVCAYDVDDDGPRRERLRKLLEGAVKFAGDWQQRRGGWGPDAIRNGAEDPVTTIDMLHALFAARKAGIDVPKAVTDKGAEYLDRSAQIFRRGIPDDITFTTGQAHLSAGAAAALLMHDGPRPGVFVRCLRHLQTVTVPAWPTRPTTTTMSTHLHLARLTHALGENGLRQFDPDPRADRLKWSAYREKLFPTLVATQAEDGSWAETVPGPVYGSAIALVILQMENDHLQAFSR